MAGSLPLIRPMLATLGELPEPPGWGYEFKWDESGRVPKILSQSCCESEWYCLLHGDEYVESGVVAEAEIEIAHWLCWGAAGRCVTPGSRSSCPLAMPPRRVASSFPVNS